MNKTTNMRRKDIRWKLLTSVSAATLFASAYSASEAQAAGAESDRPTLWIELGGQLDQLTDPEETFSPPFMALITRSSLLSALNVQHQPTFAIDEEGKISFQPDDSDWVFSASIRFGRSQAEGHKNHQTKNAVIPVHFSAYGQHHPKYKNSKYYYPGHYNRFAEGISHQSEQHLILDFQAGKDVGIGLFGRSASSVLSAGVRFAQLSSKSNVTLHAVPDLQYPTKPVTSLPAFKAFEKYPIQFHGYTGQADSERSFRGVGPSLAWNASVPFAGNLDRGEITFDWGANAAILFGRQKIRGNHDTTTRTYVGHQWKQDVIRGNGYSSIGYFVGGNQYPPKVSHAKAGDFNRMQMVTVPNLGGFAGFSFLYSGAKISLGYRADFFFGAIDGGIDTAKKENVGFYGPFATISVGLGG